jgi:hypothetical protein
MKNYRRLVEDTNNLEKLFRTIEKDCQPFLRYRKALWRGLDSKGQTFGEKKVRKDRVPLAGNQEMTDFTNAFLKEKGLPRRDRSMFATPKEEYAQVFGDTCLVFPKGRSKMVWFPQIIDMNSMKYQQFGHWLKDLEDKSIFKKSFKDQVYHFQKQVLQDEMDRKSGEHWDTMFVQKGMTAYVTALEGFENKKMPPIGAKNEVIIECDSYYWIRKQFSVNDDPTDQAIERFNLK